MASLTWVLGIRTLPAAVHEGEPTIVVWLDGDQVLSFQLVEGGPPTDDDLRATFDEAQQAAAGEGPRARPRKIRVESGPLAKRVRALFKGIEVELGRTDAIDAFFATLAQTALDDRREGLALLDAAPEALRAELRDLAVALEESAAWDLLPLDPLVVRIPALDLPAGLIGPMGDDLDTPGLLMFFRPEDQEAFVSAVERSPETAPRCLAAKVLELPNEDGTFFDALVPKAFARGGSEVCTERELSLLIATGRALCRFVTEHEDALVDEQPTAGVVTSTYDVPVAGRTVEVTLEAHARPSDEAEG